MHARRTLAHKLFIDFSNTAISLGFRIFLGYLKKKKKNSLSVFFELFISLYVPNYVQVCFDASKYTKEMKK